MPQQISRWAIVLTLLLATSILAGYTVHAQDVAQDAEPAKVYAVQACRAPDVAAQDAGPESDVPVNVKAGAEEPRAHQPDSPRRLEAPERRLADFSGRAMPAPSTSVSRIAVLRIAPLGSSTAATPLHLSHCVFLC